MPLEPEGDRYIRYTPSCIALWRFPGGAPLVFCLLFSPPAHYLVVF